MRVRTAVSILGLALILLFFIACGESTIHTLALQLKDENSKMRAAAATQLGEVGGERAVSLLIDVLEKGDEKEVIDAVIGALVKIGKPAVLPLSTYMQGKRSSYLVEYKYPRMRAAWALGEIGDRTAIKALKYMLADISPTGSPESVVVNAATKALEKLGYY